jgi:hypothetical protein
MKSVLTVTVALCAFQSIRAEPVVEIAACQLGRSIVDGPIIAQVTLRNLSDKAVSLAGRWSPDDPPWVKITGSPPNWRVRDKKKSDFEIINTSMRPVFSVKPDETVTSFVYLHHQFAVPSGRFRIQLQFHSEHIGGQAVDVACPLDLEVSPRSPERLREIERKLRLVISDTAATDTSRLDAARQLLWLESDDSIESLLRLVTDPKFRTIRYDVYDFVYARTLVSPGALEILVAYLAQYGNYDDAYFFGRWKAQRTELDGKAISRLLAANNPWIKVLTCRHFPVTVEAKNAVLEETQRMKAQLEESLPAPRPEKQQQ